MKDVYIFRMCRSDQGTEGVLATEGFNCKTLELPWRDNQRQISCVPPGSYRCIIRKSPKFGITYWVLKVKNRTYILIHKGNFAGDVKKGFKSHVAGCILLGLKHGVLGKQRAVLNSRVAVRRFMSHMMKEPFMLHVKEAF